MSDRLKFSDAEIQRVKDRNPISTVIAPYVTWDKAKSNFAIGDHWACCPFHAEKSPSFHCDDRTGTYKCFGCGASGDHIEFLQEHNGISFVEAVKILGGEAEAEPLSPEQIAEDKRKREARQRAAEQAQNDYRQKEIARALKIFNSGGRVAGTEGADYLRGRRLLPCPVRLPIRFHPHFKFWHQRQVPGRKKPELYVLFSGPALMLPITGPKHEFLGTHITWIDPARPGKKIEIADPEAEPKDDGTQPLVPARKIRGSKSNASIKLWTPERFNRLVIGEGWETTASVLLSEIGTERFERTAYWVAVSLQALGGRAVETVAHPTLKNKAGRPAKVPGPVPDMSDPKALTIPDCVDDVLRLGDGDSDRFTAEQVHARSKTRWARQGRRDATAWAPDGKDFNDILVGA